MVRKAQQEDITVIGKVFRAAKAYMVANGNTTQWAGAYPDESDAQRDLNQDQLYVVCDEDGAVHGTFAFVIGEEPTYAAIENGTWRSDAPYGTIHRLAGDGAMKGIFAQCLAYCQSLMGHIRSDTHADNHTLQHLLTKGGFVHRGTIYVADGTPRMAYDFLAGGEEQQ